jgi:hypothetical protein
VSDSSSASATSIPANSFSSAHPLWLLFLATVLPGLAGGMAWGIRGQYGHEMGAMIFGILVGFTLVLLFMPNASALQAARVIGFFTLAIGFGGSMTYGQTVGLTMDSGVHGNSSDPHWNRDAYLWGMLGLAVKGGLWIGFGGLFLGMGMSGQRYTPRHMLWIGIAMMALFVIGRWALNTPFDPDQKKLPLIYFSDHWRWEPAENVNPRPELWGGLFFAIIGLFAWLFWIKQDRLAVRLGCWGILGGLGFPIGQAFQAAHAWDSAKYISSSWWQIGYNTWNMMEVTFGVVAGLMLGVGVWINRHRISQDRAAAVVSLSPAAEGWLIASYVYVLGLGWYFGNSIFTLVHAHGLLLGMLPMIAIAGGRYSPFLYVLPIVALSIIVKTFLAVCRETDFVGTSVGLIFVATIPLLFLVHIALRLGTSTLEDLSARRFARIGLLLTSALYFWLNFTFLGFPWQWWSDWRGMLAQKNSGGIYVVGWVVLSLAALCCRTTAAAKEKPT